MVINHLLILPTGMILQVLEITKTKNLPWWLFPPVCWNAEIRFFQACSFAHDRDEIRRGQKKKLSKAASSKATEQVEQCPVDLGLWGLYFPLYGGSKKRGWEDFRPDSESVFGCVSSWPSRRWYSFGCVGPSMGAGWRFFCIFFLTPKMREVPKTGGTRKKTEAKQLLWIQVWLPLLRSPKLKTSWAKDTPPNAIPLADQAGFIKDYQLNHHHPLVRPFFFGIISWVVAFFWSHEVLKKHKRKGSHFLRWPILLYYSWYLTGLSNFSAKSLGLFFDKVPCFRTAKTIWNHERLMLSMICHPHNIEVNQWSQRLPGMK